MTDQMVTETEEPSSPFPEGATLHRPFNVVDGLNPSSLNLLAAGAHVGLITESSLLDEDLLEAAVSEIDDIEAWDLYDPFVEPQVARLGPAAFSFMAEMGMEWVPYRTELARATQQMSMMPNMQAVLAKMFNHISSATGMPVVPATHRGHELGTCIVRDIRNGNGVHFDDANAESIDLLDQRLASQFSFLVTLVAPEAGGECVVYDRQYVSGTPLTELRGLIGDSTARVLPPVPGTLYGFSTRNLHEVRTAFGERRITISFFVGQAVGENVLYAWA